jgi:hypothetical protein
MIVVLFILGLIGGFLSGLLGLGGAIVMIPLMLTVPPLAGVGELSVHTVAGLSMLQVLFSSLSGILIHHKNRYVHYKTLLYIGIPMGIASLGGAYWSKCIPEKTILCIFGALIVVALVTLITDTRKTVSDSGEISDFTIRPAAFILTGTLIGTVSGIVGAGGGFVIVPVMVSFLKIPLRITIGSSLGIVFIGALMGAIGKIVSLQVDPVLILPLIAGSVISARLGATLSKQVSTTLLRYLLIGVVILSGLQILFRAL